MKRQFLLKASRLKVIMTFVTIIILGVINYSYADNISGKVLSAGSPIQNSTVTMYSAGTGAPVQISQVSSNDYGEFTINYSKKSDDVFYIIAKDGKLSDAINTNSKNSLTLLTLLGNSFPDKIVINELTTVASAFTAAQFIDGESISGNISGLKIAALNAPNLIDPATGKWGKVLLDAINSSQNVTLSSLNTLGSLITAYATVTDDNWRGRFLKACTPAGGTEPTNTLEAISGIAKSPWANPAELFSLFDAAYPQPKDGAPRFAPFIPYLFYAPKDFALMLCFAGGGIYSAGKLCLDAEGTLWSGQNWMPGSQSGVLNGLGGGTIKVTSNGIPLSPPIFGFRGNRVDGVGWGTAVTQDRVWIGSLSGGIAVMDFEGNLVAPESDFPMAGKTGNLMGIGVAANGDVWIADGTNDQMLFFPKGEIRQGIIVKVEGLKSPFGVAVDNQNRVWVSNSQSNTLVRFSADDPSKTETFNLGISVRGVALDSKGNLWVASNASLNFPEVPIPPGTSIMKQFQILGKNMMENVTATNTTGIVNMIRPDGTQPNPSGYNGGKEINVPWGVSIDGNDDVWVGNFYGRGVVLMAGADPKGRSAGKNTGDVIHSFQGGSLQMVTDVIPDAAGNLWVANNWNVPEAVLDTNPALPTSTWGGGSGIVVIYGIAAPTRTPVMGHAQQP